jgi:hypothetical protein
VQELSATAWRAPTVSANSASKRLASFPVVSHPERSTAVTAAISASPIEGT